MNNITLRDFFKDNEYRIDEDGAVLTPPIYYQSLHEAFNNYFKTVKNNKNSYHFLLDFSDRKKNSFDFHNLDSAVFTILGFHRFFELLLKDILRRIDPFFAVKFPEKEKDTIDFYNDRLDADKMETVEFKKAFERFKEAITYGTNNPDKPEYDIAKQFSFLKADDTLEILARWRNRIMHNGQTLPNIYLLDYLISQRIIPMIADVIRTEKKILKEYLPHYFQTLTGINIIDEISKIKIDYKDFSDKRKAQELAIKILRLAHLKELGRASYTLDIVIKNNRSYDAPYYNDPIGRNMKFAATEKNNESFYAIKKCPCCGFETLVVYRQEYYDIFKDSKAFISWFNCFTCSYSLKNNIGDPEYFGYSKEKLFATT